eukprot:c21597_g1_i5.p1 GENE.c21597_g1_i5~~c21597_g1_i5.p1  ORF type:complete len:684 (-),score=268.33 c21597_g1_i5:4-2055(-)
MMTELMKTEPHYRDLLNHFKHNSDEEPSTIADIIAASTTASGDELQEILECLDVETRLTKSLILLKKELELSKFQKQIADAVKERITKQERKEMLLHQMKFIMQELGEQNDERKLLIEKFWNRLAKLDLPKDVSQVIKEEINKLSELSRASSEYSISRTYLEWLTSLPWKKVSVDVLHVDIVANILNADHYGLEDVKDRIKEFIAVSMLLGKVQGKIICFVGPPGVGKTSIGKSIARTLGRKFFRFSVGGMNDVAEIKGHRRTYIGAMPGKIIQCLKTVQTSNPVILIDEIDKLSKGNAGDPASALLEVLDPEQNKSFRDHYLDVDYDLSQVLFLCTANVLETIPQPLLDRMEVITISGYVTEEKVAIALKYLVPETIKKSGLTDKQIVIEKETIDRLIRWYCREAGVRNLKHHIEKITRKVAYKVAKQRIFEDEFKLYTKWKNLLLSFCQIFKTGQFFVRKIVPYVVTKDNLEEYVGKPVYRSDRFYDVLPAGVTMGLVWTSMGGATLYIESVGLPTKEGKGSLQTTGQMGDIMKESSVVCYTFAKKFLFEIDPNNHFFDLHDIHLHIPEGATPKDGPSAGVTMVTSLISLALNKLCESNIAMTGEISLTGKVLKIGGVREKIIAAKRSQVNKIFLPKENERDFEELPDFIRGGVTIIYANNYSDIFSSVFSSTSSSSQDKQ